MQKGELYALDLSRVTWEKSSFSGPDGNCVEVAQLPGGAVALRDSDAPHREALRFTATEWAAFRAAIAAGELPS